MHDSHIRKIISRDRGVKNKRLSNVFNTTWDHAYDFTHIMTIGMRQPSRRLFGANTAVGGEWSFDCHGWPPLPRKKRYSPLLTMRHVAHPAPRPPMTTRYVSIHWSQKNSNFVVEKKRCVAQWRVFFKTAIFSHPTAATSQVRVFLNPYV